MSNLLDKRMVNTSELILTIRPRDIDTSQNTLQNAFRDPKSDVSACWLIQYAQQRDEGWDQFTKEAINNLYRDDRLKYHVNEGEFQFYSLIDDGYIIEDAGYCYFTQEFILRAFLANPKG